MERKKLYLLGGRANILPMLFVEQIRTFQEEGISSIVKNINFPEALKKYQFSRIFRSIFSEIKDTDFLEGHVFKRLLHQASRWYRELRRFIVWVNFSLVIVGYFHHFVGRWLWGKQSSVNLHHDLPNYLYSPQNLSTTIFG